MGKVLTPIRLALIAVVALLLALVLVPAAIASDASLTVYAGAPLPLVDPDRVVPRLPLPVTGLGLGMIALLAGVAVAVGIGARRLASTGS